MDQILYFKLRAALCWTIIRFRFQAKQILNLKLLDMPLFSYGAIPHLHLCESPREDARALEKFSVAILR